MKTKKILLILILILGALLRFYLLGHNPPSLNSDEVAIGYNAYSILHTGRDEYGQFLPLSFRSFDDYKPPLYIYLTVPSVALFGLNEFAVRFPSAVIGLLAVASIYLLTNELIRNKKVALTSALLLAISPWHLIFTRTAYETAMLVFTLSFGSYLFLKGKTNVWLYVFSAIVFALSPFAYQAGKVATPLLVAFLILFELFRTSHASYKKVLLIVLFVLLLTPGLLTLISKEGSTRFRGLSVFSDAQIADKIVTEKQIDWIKNDNRSAVLFHPEISGYTFKVVENYLVHFRPDFLFLGQDDSRSNYVTHHGLLYLVELPLLIVGLYFLIRNYPKYSSLFIAFWILISPLPASVVSGAPSSVRSALIMVPLYVTIAVGILGLCKLASQLYVQRLAKIIFVLVLCLLYIYSLASYLHQSFVHAPIEKSKNWYYSYGDIAKYAQSVSKDYNKIYVSIAFDEPYVFFLFYLHKDPLQYLSQTGGTVSGGFKENRNKFDNFYFTDFDWSQVRKDPHALAIGTPSDFPSDSKPIKTFYYLNGQPSAFVMLGKK